ncbi:MAG: hypothetical protein WCT49_05320 [Candidatus Paceibacterota bacterium]|jgi:hypothetical protein|nr:hypothetical protein [Candidatus Paceibacterota bacterium]
MSEKQPQIEIPCSELPIEQQANFEGSWTNLMCERLRNPEIRKQVIDLIWEQELVIQEELKKIREEGQKIERTLITRQEMENNFEKVLDSVERDTPVFFGKTMPNANGQVGEEEKKKLKEGERYDKDREIMNLDWIFPDTNNKLTAEQWNITESHEKGHVLRRYSGRCFSEKFLKAFDLNTIKVSESEFEEWMNVHPSAHKKPKSTEDLEKMYKNYLNNPKELAERMSQLKNYFGMSGIDKFSKEHLAYAREHYIKDTDFDNMMTKFFQAITPEKEDAFIELINSAGI